MSFAFKVFKETALPAILEPHAVYFIAPASSPELVEIYVTNATAGVPVRHVINKTEIQSMIDASIGAANELTIVATIAERDALAPTTPVYVYVEDATDDTTVASGGATYLYKPATSEWIKTSEAESLDVTVTWASLLDKPASTPAQIDAAVSVAHAHANKTELDLIGQSDSGELTYNGVPVKTQWSSTVW